MCLPRSYIPLLCWCMVALRLQVMTTQACSCVTGQTLLKEFTDNGTGVVLQAAILNQTNTSDLILSYSARIIQIWKGCSAFKGVNTTTITTDGPGAGCFMTSLTPGTTYFLTGTVNSSQNSVMVYFCGFHEPWNYLNATQQNDVEQLSKKYTTCSGTTPTSSPRPTAASNSPMHTSASNSPRPAATSNSPRPAATSNSPRPAATSSLLYAVAVCITSFFF